MNNNNSTLKQIYHDHHGKVSDKWSLYLDEYDRLLSGRRNDDINLLEIGIQNGGSMEIWADYFPLALNLIGCDINPDCQRLRYADERVSVVVGDANLDATEARILALARRFDVIIDDGSHLSSDIVKSFVRYFPHLAEGGIFIVEDLHCSYWREFEGGLFDPDSSIKFLQALADVTNHEHWGVSRSRADFLDSFARRYGVSFNEELLAQVHSIEFVNSLCVIRKRPPVSNVLGPRIIVGEDELVASDVKHYHGSSAVPLDQSNNPWSVSAVDYLAAARREIVALQETLDGAERNAVLLTTQRQQEANEQEQKFSTLLSEQEERWSAAHSAQELKWSAAHTEQEQTWSATLSEQEQKMLAVLSEQDQKMSTALSEQEQKMSAAHREKEQQMSAAQSEQQRQLDELRLALAGQEGQVARLHLELESRDVQVGELRRVLDERDTQLAQSRLSQETATRYAEHLEGQRNVLNAEIFRLNAEAARFGARVGRKIGTARGVLAPAGSRRDALTTLGVRFVTKVAVAGPKEATGAAYRYFSVRLRTSLFARSSAAAMPAPPQHPAENMELHIEQGGVMPVRTDHPQLRDWIEANEPGRAELLEQRRSAATFAYQPLISVIVPIYKVPRDVLDDTLECLRDQTYANWEGCIVWADTADTEGWEWLQAKAAAEPRFKIRFLEENTGISGNSNAALEFATGEYLALLDHDDTISPWAFYEAVKILQTKPETDFLYSDKDSVTADGQIRLNALFKPDWSPEMLHSVNYLTHLNFMRTSVVRQVGGWDKDTDGAQDWDIFFKVTEQAKHIARIPSILYHWRILPTSTATGLAAKPYAAMGQLRSQQNYFKRKGLAATVMPTTDGLFHVRWPAQASSVDVVLYQNGPVENLCALVESMRAHHHGVLRNMYVVHALADSAQMIAASAAWEAHIILLPVEHSGWRAALAALPLIANEQIVVLLDGNATALSDTVVEELAGWVSHHGEIAWTGALALSADHTVFEAGRVVAADYNSAPLFAGSPLYSFGWFGGPLWYRNARSTSPYAFGMKAGDMYRALDTIDGMALKHSGFDEFCVALASAGRRGLINPFARVQFGAAPEAAWPNNGQQYHDDPYFNPAFDQVSPLRLHS